ncbi:MAG: hypothetical protein ACFFDJ_03060 [Candidatus Odinarchaeota archaeon]
MTSIKNRQELDSRPTGAKKEIKRDYWRFFGKVLAILGLPLLLIAVLFALWSYNALILLKVIFLSEADFKAYLAETWVGTVPEGIQPSVLYANASLVHDLGIILATLGLIFLFMAATYIMRELLARPRVPRDPKEYFMWFFKWSDSYFVITCFLILFAWAGIWVFIHQAYVLELEIWRRTLTDPQLYAFLGLSSPSLVRWGIIFVIITVGILGVFVYGFLTRKEIDAKRLRHVSKVAHPPKKAEWRGFFQIVYINSDWLFYLIIFVIYVFIVFGLWIFLFEGFFARANNIAIKWAILAVLGGGEIELPHGLYYFAGIILVYVCFGFLLALMKWVSRDPQYSLKKVPDRRLVSLSAFAARMKKSGKWFGAITVVSFIFLFLGTVAFLLGFNLISSNEVLALQYHNIGQVIMFAWAIIMFYLIIIERSGERLKLVDKSLKQP